MASVMLGGPGVAALSGRALATTSKATSKTAEATRALGQNGSHAANGADIAGARFAQTTVREGFQKGGLFEGRTFSDVVGDLRSGVLTPKDIPINVVVRDGNTLILNTRSAMALTRAEIPRSSWNVVDRTGDDFSRASSMANFDAMASTAAATCSRTDGGHHDQEADFDPANRVHRARR